ncbi:adenosylmethionine--8-amino-7-oxononanoate transaminase [Desulfovibrio sp. OttesenSCG-928-A18]|nr:adenosylmethionine--8-amino-7-oxononanoate transaminase [Desulfovibrio sp. OttesenSCG-928-A18]
MPQQTILCITGTDTDAGKSVVCAALACAATARGLSCLLIKPVQTGCLTLERAERAAFDGPPGPKAPPGAAPGALATPDLALYRLLCPEARALCIVCLPEPCSPHLAAARAGLEPPSAALLAEETRRLMAANPADLVIIEGAGGLLTPLNERESLLEYFLLLKQPLLLTVPNRLGAINHALLNARAAHPAGPEAETAGAARASAAASPATPAGAAAAPLCTGLARAGSGEKGPLEEAIRRDNAHCLERMTGLPCLAGLPWIPKLARLPQCSANPAPGRMSRARGSGRSQDEADFGLEAARAALSAAAGPLLEAILAPPRGGGLRPGKEKPYEKALAPVQDGAGTPGRPLPAFTGPGAAPMAAPDLLRYDREHVWHPYTSALHPLMAREAVATEGCRIILRDGRALVDGMASWWCAIHGYRHPALMRALREQALRMPHVMFGGLTHAPAVNLARRLLDMAPDGLEHIFFADSGSVSVEAAIKMALQYQQARGLHEKKRLVTVRGGYHGDSFGAMSVCDPEQGMHSLFRGMLPAQHFAPCPDIPFAAGSAPSPDAKAGSSPSLEALETILAEHGRSIAAMILEPVVQGAGGMRFYAPAYLARVRDLCSHYDCLLILDEIATGFGRTGRLFACEWAGVRPDIMCVGKALTGGVMTLAATLASAGVARGISASGGVFMHGPTFMANPLACAVAGASLDLLADGSWRERVERIESAFREGLEPCRTMPGVADVRVLGAIGVIELNAAVHTEKAQDYLVREHGVWLRPFGRLVYAMPPYVISEEDLSALCRSMRGLLESGAWT